VDKREKKKRGKEMRTWEGRGKEFVLCTVKKRGNSDGYGVL